MKYCAAGNRRALRAVDGKLNALDRAVLKGCSDSLNIIRIIKLGKPYVERGSRQFATTSEIMASVDKLLRLGVLERR